MTHPAEGKSAAPAPSISESTRVWLAWFAVGMLALSTFLNYMDRQTLSLLARPIQAELSMDDKMYSYVVSCFMVSYMLGGILSPLIIDRIGAFRALPIFVGVWSLAAAAGGLAQSSFELGLSRIVLGLFETGNFIAAPIIVAMILKPHQSALGVGIYTAAAMFGAAASPPLVTWIDQWMGWRLAFAIVGGAGIVWVVLWALVPVRRAVVHGAAQADAAHDGSEKIRIDTWLAAAREPKVWAYALGSMLTYPVWFFYLNWFPKYLTDERGLSTLQMGSRAWVVYLCAAIGCLIAGSIIGLLVSRNLPPVRARLIVLAAVAFIMPWGAVNYFEPSIGVTLAVSAGVALVHMIWQTTLTSMQLEVFTAESLGKVLGGSGVISGIGGIFSTWLIGQTVAMVTYRPMFVVMSVLYLVALGIILLLFKGRRPAVASALVSQGLTP